MEKAIREMDMDIETLIAGLPAEDRTKVLKDWEAMKEGEVLGEEPQKEAGEEGQ